jgi:hypothetical protein
VLPVLTLSLPQVQSQSLNPVRADANLKKQGRSERRKKKISRKKAFLTTASRDEKRETAEGERLKILKSPN